MDKNFLLTTAPNLEGYRIIEHYGVVYGETIFKHGFFSQLGAGLMNMGIGSRELEGSMELIEDAREFAYDKMISEAKSRGANAIIAIDFDNTIGQSIMYLCLMGTAVKVIKEEEYLENIEKEKVEQAKREAEKQQVLLHQQQLDERRSHGEQIAEDLFLDSIKKDMTVASIFSKWVKTDMSSKYPKADELIKSKKASEDKFGSFTATQLNNIKQDLRIILLGK